MIILTNCLLHIPVSCDATKWFDAAAVCQLTSATVKILGYLFADMHLQRVKEYQHTALNVAEHCCNVLENILYYKRF